MKINSTVHNNNKKNNYPYIGIHKFNWDNYNDKILVIFNDQNTGFCVQDDRHNERNDNDKRFMSFRQDWCEIDFIPYDGTISISN